MSEYRRLYLITPKIELLQLLGVNSGADHPVSAPAAVITEKLDYDMHFEGWRKSWRTKAKEQFIEQMLALWTHTLPKSLVESLTLATDANQGFDPWWSINEDIDVFEIDSEWRPH